MDSLLYVKSNECRSALRKLQHSNPYNSIGKHLDFTSFRITTSEARFSNSLDIIAIVLQLYYCLLTCFRAFNIYF